MDYGEYLKSVGNLEAFKKVKPPGWVVRGLARYAAQVQEKDFHKLNRMAEALAGEFVASSSQQRSSPAVQLGSEFLVGQINPWVRQVRHDLFDSDTPPFDTVEEAQAWFRELDDSATRKTSTTRQMVQVSHATGFSQESLFKYILVGTKPTLTTSDIFVGRETEKLPTGQTLTRPFITVEIYDEPTFKEFRSIYQRIRQHLKMTKSKSLSKRQLELFRMAQEKGYPPPRQGIKKYCESLRVEWNKHHRKARPYKSWKGIQKALQRIEGKLNTQYQVQDA